MSVPSKSHDNDFAAGSSGFPLHQAKSVVRWAIVVGVGAFLTLVAVKVFVKPYDVPEYAEVESSESAFLIPLEGDSENQSALVSIKFLEEKKIAARRVRIPHRWSQMGFLPTDGKWIPMVRLIKVDRRPITREWTRFTTTGTSKNDEAIAAESKDSVNFSMGITCTAHIPEDLTATFLYSYPSKSLAEMMDTEIRSRIQLVVSEEAGNYDVFTLPSKKNEIMKAVREEVVPFFKKKGIEITTIGNLAGLSFENPEIQRAIDDSAKAAQMKVAAEAKRATQEVENKTLLLAAEGKNAVAKKDAESKAEVEFLKSENEAKVKLKSAEAESEGIKKIAEARAFEAQKAMEHAETFARLRSIDAEMERWKRWDGRMPTYLIQGGGLVGSNSSGAGLVGASSVPNLHLMLPPMSAEGDVAQVRQGQGAASRTSAKSPPPARQQ